MRSLNFKWGGTEERLTLRAGTSTAGCSESDGTPSQMLNANFFRGALSYYKDASIVATIGLIIFIGPWILKMTKNLGFTRESMLLTLFIGFFTIALNQGGAHSPAAFWLMLIPFFAVYMGSHKAGIYWLALTITAILVIYHLHTKDILYQVEFVNNEELLKSVSIIGLILIIYSFIYIFEQQEIHRISLLQDSLAKRKRVSKKLLTLAQYDPLTNLPNRSYCNALLNRAIIHAKKSAESFAILYIDLDNFKNINNLLGHDIGGLLLIESAKRFRKCLKEGDSVCRLGGDEFICIIRKIERYLDAENVAKKIIIELCKPCMINKYSINTSPSIGIAIFSDQSTDKTSLIKSAEIAMYSAKNLGKNTYKFYTKEIDQKLNRMATIEEHLSKAIENNEFTMAYQPQFSPKTLEIVGIEALLRWDNSDLGKIGPDEFIPIAEKMGVITLIGDWVIKQSCTDLQTWLNAGLISSKIKLAINLSIIQVMQKDFLDTISAHFKTGEINTNLIELELTESMIMSDSVETINILEKLRNLGLSIAIDDFGVGNSSLNRIATIPADILKIDKSFVDSIPHDRKSVATIRSVISLAHGLDLKIVAEGVETHEQFEFLKEYGVYAIQGFYISAPVNNKEILNLLKTNSKLASKLTK